MVNTEKKPVPFIIGLALFSMFFGSGNLIFTLFVGKLAQSNWFFTATGFLITGVFMPFIGIVAMVLFKGDYNKFFACLGKTLGFIIPFLLLTVWIPFGSAPRCITLSYSSLDTYLTLPPAFILNLIYCALLFFVVIQRSRMLDILGYVLTPLLLTSLSIIAVKGIFFSGSLELSALAPSALFTRGMVEGYNTMDLIASFFFSASIIHLLSKACKEKGKEMTIVLKSGIVGVSLLGIVYFTLIYLAALHAPYLAGVPKDRLLAHLAMIILGEKLGIIAAIAVALACFTTSVALTFVYADFIAPLIKDNSEKKIPSILLSLVITYVMSNFGLKGITALTAPILQVFYPMLMILIVVNMGKLAYVRFGRKDTQPSYG